MSDEAGASADGPGAAAVRGLPRPDRLRIADLAGAFSPRVTGENTEHVSRLSGLDRPLPPIVVHRGTMRVVDGMHRVRAAALRGDEFIDAVFFDGSEDLAFVLAVELNHDHGLPLSTADRTAAAGRIVELHPEWSDRRIAAVVGLAPSTVGTIRARSAERTEQLNSRTGRDGRVRPRDSAEGRRIAGELILSRPTASLREIARAAGISPATVSDVRARLARGEPPVTARHQSGRPLAVTCMLTSTQPCGTTEVERPRESGPSRTDAGDASAAKIVGALARDPSLRSSEAGRALLRFLGGLVAGQRQWDAIARSVPAHQRKAVVQLVQECAERWQWFADHLDRSAGDTRRGSSA